MRAAARSFPAFVDRTNGSSQGVRGFRLHQQRILRRNDVGHAADGSGDNGGLRGHGFKEHHWRSLGSGAQYQRVKGRESIRGVRYDTMPPDVAGTAERMRPFLQSRHLAARPENRNDNWQVLEPGHCFDQNIGPFLVTQSADPANMKSVARDAEVRASKLCIGRRRVVPGVLQEVHTLPGHARAYQVGDLWARYRNYRLEAAQCTALYPLVNAVSKRRAYETVNRR